MSREFLHLLKTQARPLASKTASAFAPSNIALIKYWGKRDNALNLPLNDSLSISLGTHGSTTQIQISNTPDRYYLNGQAIPPETDFAKRLKQFLDLTRPKPEVGYDIHTTNNIPTAAGLASSASGFAALSLALNTLYQWDLPLEKLSILARLGSGSACRSLWDGFVHWHQGQNADGLDSHGHLLPIHWPEFRIGLHVISDQAKALSSRAAMKLTAQKPQQVRIWQTQVEEDLQDLTQALSSRDFSELGRIAERNALRLHELLEAADIHYSLPETLEARTRVQACRHQGIEVYFTQDAGPNLKLLFLAESTAAVKRHFPDLIVIQPMKE